MKACFTIAASNYLPQAKVFALTAKNWNPDFDIFIVVADAHNKDNLSNLPSFAKVVPFLELKTSSKKTNLFKYNVVEYCTSIKAECFQYFQAQGYKEIVYLDPDIAVYSSLDCTLPPAGKSIALTPHILSLSQSHLCSKGLSDLLACGTYNLGFIALRITPTSSEFLRWWNDRLDADCFDDRRNGLFVDQKWIDLIPGLLKPEVEIVTHEGCNVAHWNIHERRIQISNSGYFINSVPLCFYHFSGFRPNFSSNTVTAAEASIRDDYFSPEIRRIYEQYKAIWSEGLDKTPIPKYRFSGFANGVPIQNEHRRIYRRLTACQREIWDDPFSVGNGTFYDSLKKHRLLASGHEPGCRTQRPSIEYAKNAKRVRALLWLAFRLLGWEKYRRILSGVVRITQSEEHVFLLPKKTLYNQGKRS